MQKALDNILRHYLKKETGAWKGNPGTPDNDNEPTFTLPEGEDGELLRSLYQCLEEKGVLREVQAFLRTRLISVLQGTWPQLFDQARKDRDFTPAAVTLIEDFLCSHKLLFTFSVLATELGDEFEQKTDFGKMPSARAEQVLADLEIQIDSVLSRQILERYAQPGRSSLLECIISSSGLPIVGETAYISKDRMKGQYKNDLSLNEKLKNIDDKYATAGTRKRLNKDKNNFYSGAVDGVDKRFRTLALSLEREKQIQLKAAIEKFKEEERSRIRDEIETELKFELLRKEKELLANYEEKVNHMKGNLEREKELWLNEKRQREEEILDRREELVEAIQSIREQQRREAMESESQSHNSNHEREEAHAQKSKSENMADGDAEETKMAEWEGKRYFLLKEAKLRNDIERLARENQELRSRTEVNNGRRSPRPVTPKRRKTPVSPVRHREHRKLDPVENTDTIAFMQYQLEKQAEELEALRRETRRAKTKPNEPKPSKDRSPTTIPKLLESTELDGFLFEAKKRMAAIERDAQLVESTLSQFQEQKRLGSARPPLSIPQLATASPEFQLRFPGDDLQMPVQPKIPKSLLTSLSLASNENIVPKYLEAGARRTSLDFSIPFEHSKVSFLTSYRDELKTGAFQQERPKLRMIPETDQTQVPLNNSNSKSSPSTISSETLASSSSLKATNLSKEAEPKASKSKSRSSSTSTSRSRRLREKANKSGALIKDKVPSVSEDGDGSEISLSLNSKHSDSNGNRKAARKTFEVEKGTEPKQEDTGRTQFQSQVPPAHQSIFLASLGGDESPERDRVPMKKPETEREDELSVSVDSESNQYEEGKIEGSDLRRDDEDDFFALY